MSVQVMLQRTNEQLFSYWDAIRGDRIAPNRFEIEPSDIAGLLAEAFIIDCSGASTYRFRLAGTQICEQIGRELRGEELLDLWQGEDREAMAGLLHGVVQDGSVGIARFAAIADQERSAQFELTLMPLIHSSQTINRILGAISAIEPPYWLGSVAIESFQLDQIDIVFPGGKPHFLSDLPASSVFTHEGNYTIAGDNVRRFKVFEGGRSDARE